MSRVITLTTDFGGSDTYVAAMKGVLLSLVPDIQIVDVTHEIDAQDIWGAAYSASTLMSLFPADTIHIVVVDPGVGSDRKGMILETEHGLYVAPDNGVLTPLLDREPIRAGSIANPEVMRPVGSATFHGRDVFAPAAGHLAMGEPLSNFGEPIDKPVVATNLGGGVEPWRLSSSMVQYSQACACRLSRSTSTSTSSSQRMT